MDARQRHRRGADLHPLLVFPHLPSSHLFNTSIYGIGDGQCVSTGAIGIGVHHETYHNPLVLHGLSGFL